MIAGAGYAKKKQCIEAGTDVKKTGLGAISGIQLLREADARARPAAQGPPQARLRQGHHTAQTKKRPDQLFWTGPRSPRCAGEEERTSEYDYEHSSGIPVTGYFDYLDGGNRLHRERFVTLADKDLVAALGV